MRFNGEIMKHTILEMTQNELQCVMDYIMQHEIPCLLELLSNAENEKELKFYQKHLIATQTRYAEYHLQHLKNFCNL